MARFRDVPPPALDATPAAGFGMVLELEAHGPDTEEAVITLADLSSARRHEIEEHQVA